MNKTIYNILVCTSLTMALAFSLSAKAADLTDSIDSYKKILFNEITPGSFMMGKPGSQVSTEITKPFALAQTELTQLQWARLKIAMGEKDKSKINPSYNSASMGHCMDILTCNGEIIVINIEGNKVQLRPDHPVESISWNAIKEFIDGLNKLSNSDEIKVQSLLSEVIPGHQKGDVYDFPTEAQWEFVMRDRGNANKNWFDREDDADLEIHAWYRKNSNYGVRAETQPVATRRPRLIDGQPFYDLEGNVWEWLKDSQDYSNGMPAGGLPGGKDPLVVTNSSYHVQRGGSYELGSSFLQSASRRGIMNIYGYNDVGLRLVRTRP